MFSRSDLTKLGSAGLVPRTHGGAIMASHVLREPSIVERAHDDKKRLIAEKALEFVHERDIILIDTGTTMVAFAQALARSDINELTVFSNDLDVIRTLEEKEHFTLSLPGGKVRNGFHYCYGDEIRNELSNCRFSTLFLAASAIHPVYGLTTENPELARIKSEMIIASVNVILLADSSKVGNIHFRKFASLSDADTLIMDRNLSPDEEKLLSASVRELLLV